MRKIENDCCDCAVPGYPCRGEHCSRRRVPHFYCDSCGEEALLYHYEGEELCEGCLLDKFEKVEGSGD